MRMKISLHLQPSFKSIPLRQPKPGGPVPVNSHLMRLDADRPPRTAIGKDFICRAEITRRFDRPQGHDACGRYARAMFEVVIFKRGWTRWEWQVCDRKGNAIMRGWEHTRPAAKYRGNRALFLLLAAAHYGPRETR
jgi:hypothetical protein